MIWMKPIIKNSFTKAAGFDKKTAGIIPAVINIKASAKKIKQKAETLSSSYLPPCERR